MGDFYLKLFNHFPLPVLLLEPKKEKFLIRDANEQFWELVGLEYEELRSGELKDIFLSFSEQGSQAYSELEFSINKVLKTGKKDRITCLSIAFGNSDNHSLNQRCWEVVSSPIFNKNKVQFTLLVITDQTIKVLEEKNKIKIKSELEEKEKELIKRKKRYKALVREAFDLVSILEFNGNYKFVSESSTGVLGISPEEFMGKNAFNFIHPDDKDRVLREFSNLEFQKKIKINPFRFRDKKGNWRWMETNATNLTDDPNVEGIVTNSREVTDLIKKNCELRQVYERIELAVAATGDLIYDWNLVTDSVKRFFTGKEKQFGYEREEIDQRQFWKQHVHPEELEDLKKLLKNALSDPNRSQIRTTYRIKRADGSYAHLIDRGMILRNEKGQAIRLIGATSDISSLVSKRDALKMANKRFTYAMKATREMIWDWDISKGKINRGRSFKELYGIKADEDPSVESFWFERIVEDDRERVEDSLFKAIKNTSQNKWRQEYKICKPKGENAYVIDRGYIIRDDNGTAVRMVGATLDVSQSRLMLKKIKKQNKVLKEVAWEQAHVVRAPIARLKGLLNLFDEDFNGEWEKEEILQLIKNSAEELDNVVTRIIRKTEEIKIED